MCGGANLQIIPGNDTTCHFENYAEHGRILSGVLVLLTKCASPHRVALGHKNGPQQDGQKSTDDRPYNWHERIRPIAVSLASDR